MTSTLLAAHSLTFVVGLIASSLAIQFVLRPAIIDSFRQRIFAIRRDAFFLVANGVIPYEDAEYIATDLYLNGLLRFAERFTFVRLVVGMWVYGRHEAHIALAMDMPLSANPDTQKMLKRIRVRATERLIWHIFETSPTAWVFVIALLPVTIARQHTGKLRVSILRAMGSLMPETKIEREVTMMANSEDACLAAA